MHNFLMGGLGISTVVLYDGSPLHQPSYLWKLVDDLGITIFGTSAKYLDELSVSFNQSLGIPPSLNNMQEILQAPVASQSIFLASHLFNWVASDASAIRLRLPRHSKGYNVGLYNR